MTKEEWQKAGVVVKEIDDLRFTFKQLNDIECEQGFQAEIAIRQGCTTVNCIMAGNVLEDFMRNLKSIVSKKLSEKESELATM